MLLIKHKNIGRFFVVVVTIGALIVAANSSQAIVMLGGLAVAYGFQMYPALIGICYYKKFTTRGVVLGLIVGLIAVTLTDKTSAWFGVPWGAYPLTIHSAGWGIVFNLATVFLVSSLFPERGRQWKLKKKTYALTVCVGSYKRKKKKIRLAWVLTLIWFLVGLDLLLQLETSFFQTPTCLSYGHHFHFPLSGFGN